MNSPVLLHSSGTVLSCCNARFTCCEWSKLGHDEHLWWIHFLSCLLMSASPCRYHLISSIGICNKAFSLILITSVTLLCISSHTNANVLNEWVKFYLQTLNQLFNPGAASSSFVHMASLSSSDNYFVFSLPMGLFHLLVNKSLLNFCPNYCNG